MVRPLKIVLFLGFLSGGVAKGKDQNRVIYGEDNRENISESSLDHYKEWSQAVAGMIAAENLEKSDFGITNKIKGSPLSKRVCQDERFASQTSATKCTGFLVSKDILVTAGHCMRTSTSCEQYKWIFDFKNSQRDSDGDMFVYSKDVYSCKEVIGMKYDPVLKLDYAVVRLDREAVDRRPFKIRNDATIQPSEEVVVIGHPSGLPMKVTDKAFVRSKDKENYFTMNSDTFGGNSGSPVINAGTGIVEGILVRGEKDYVFDVEEQCYRPYRCSDNECRGEDATKITIVEELESLNS